MLGASERKTSAALKRTQRKKEWQKKQRRATSKAARYSLPKNGLAGQMNMLKYPQASIGYSASSSSIKSEISNKFNSGLQERSAGDLKAQETRAMDSSLDSIGRSMQLNGMLRNDAQLAGRVAIDQMKSSNRDLVGLLGTLSEKERQALAGEMNKLLASKADSDKQIADLDKQLAAAAAANDDARAAALAAQLADAKARAAAVQAALANSAAAGFQAANAILDEIDSAMAVLSSALSAARFNYEATVGDINSFINRLFPGTTSFLEYYFCTTCGGRAGGGACYSETNNTFQAITIPTQIKSCFDAKMRSYGIGITGPSYGLRPNMIKMFNMEEPYRICQNIGPSGKNIRDCNNGEVGSHIVVGVTNAVYTCKINS